MPVITVKMGKVNNEVKKELIKKLTSSAVEVTKIAPESYTIFIEESEYDNIGIGGITLSEKYKK